ncbi:MAG: hypothetical protein LBI05_01805 [Planctomycetaceae bacterium]|nr:hypothetical protein [Planctomycetaceae bacterium]
MKVENGANGCAVRIDFLIRKIATMDGLLFGIWELYFTEGFRRKIVGKFRGVKKYHAGNPVSAAKTEQEQEEQQAEKKVHYFAHRKESERIYAMSFIVLIANTDTSGKHFLRLDIELIQDDNFRY